MATRFYLHGSIGIPSLPFSSAYAADWERTDSVTRHFMSLQKGSTIALDGSYEYAPVNAGTSDSLVCQYISHAPLVAQTINGTVKGQILGRRNYNDASVQMAVVIKVVSSDGGTVRGTLLSYFPPTLTDNLHYGNPFTNAYCPPSQALSSVVAQTGDYLVIEIGGRSFANSGWCDIMPFDRADLSDLPEDNTTTGNYNSWIEFDSTIDFIDKIDLYSLTAQTEYQETPAQRLASLTAQAEYTETPQIRLAACLVQVEYLPGTPFYRVVPVPPDKRCTQNQTFKRRLPQAGYLPD